MVHWAHAVGFFIAGGCIGLIVGILWGYSGGKEQGRSEERDR